MASILITKDCPRCGRRYQKIFSADEWQAYQTGKSIKDSFIDITAPDKDFLVNGICPECFDAMGGDDYNDDRL